MFKLNKGISILLFKFIVAYVFFNYFFDKKKRSLTEVDENYVVFFYNAQL